jgi:dienelactone hydrolase
MRIHGLLLLLPALLAAAEPRSQEMTLAAPDGFVLKGTLTIPPQPGRRPVVILAPQFQATRAGWQLLTDRLHAAGVATLALDLRGHGESILKAGVPVPVSDDFFASAKVVGFDRIPGDLALAAAWVRKQPGIDGRHLALAGASLGAFSVLMATPAVHPVAVLALSPAGTGAFGENARLDLARAVERGKAAVMVMASRDDADAAANAAALRPIPGVYTRLADGQEHGFGYLQAQSDTMAVFLVEYLTGRKARP